MNRRILLVLLLVTAGCASRSAGPAASPPAATVEAGRPAPPAAHENLNAVLWVQSSVEYEASARQAYRTARQQLDAALTDRRWTAALEQTADPSALKPAVVLDIDETVLDNSYYQARLVRDGKEYATDTWDRWVAEARATAIPGAREFIDYAVSKGVTIFYITNRTANLEAATRTNLVAQGFALPSAPDTVLTRGERPEWQASAKGARRAYVAREYRVLLLVGDDLGDFVVDPSGSHDERRARTAPQQEWWGERWIMLPNPTYGSWERAIIGSSTGPIAAKRGALRYDPK